MEKEIIFIHILLLRFANKYRGGKVTEQELHRPDFSHGTCPRRTLNTFITFKETGVKPIHIFARSFPSFLF
jgi:hypothetical protein